MFDFFSSSRPTRVASFEPFNAIQGEYTVTSGGQIDRLPHYFPASESAARALRELKSWHDGISNKILVGIGGTINLDIVANMKLGGAILMDKNEGQAEFWKELLATVRKSRTRGEFVEAMISRGMLTRLHPFEPDSDRDLVGQYKRENARLLRRQMDDQTSWLGTDKHYEHIRRLALNDRFATVSLDLFRDSAAVDAIRDTMNQMNEEIRARENRHGLRVAVVYLSNLREVPAYARTVHQRGRGFYGEDLPVDAEAVMMSNIEKICDRKTQVVEAGRSGMAGYDCSVRTAQQFLGRAPAQTTINL